jgi:dipeptidyl aminopeptidase/acylaminoacyl peptidase
VPKPFLARWGAALVVACGALAALPAAAQSAPPPVIDFFRHPAVAEPQLSPDGRHIAMVAPSKKDDNRLTLAVASVDEPQKLTVVAHFDDADVRGFEWVNNGRLVFWLIDLQEPAGEQRGSGLYAVNLDSTEFVWLVARRYGDTQETNIARRPLRGNHALFSTLNDGSDDVILLRYNLRFSENEQQTTMPVRVNTKTRAQKDLLLYGAPEGAVGWLLHPKTLEPRMVLSYDDKTARLLMRGPDSKEWVALYEADRFKGGKGVFRPLALEPDGKVLIAAGQDNLESTSALFRFDPKTKTLEDKPIVSLKGYDLRGGPIMDPDSGRMIGVAYVTDAPGVVWFAPEMKALQAAIDKLLPSTVNVIDCHRCLTDERVVVTASSDRLSPVYFLYTRATGKLSLIAASRPWIDDKKMAEQDVVRIKARDGLEIPLLVTKPKGKGPWPTVMLVHGGPFGVKSANWRWSPNSQFLASRGYLVVEPDFRGSGGYGFRHEKAGWKQWGLAMQDDVTDATQWAIAQGLADPRRIAIAGASYGGYATMMGLVKEPDLYRAGINWVGVTDIDLMYDIGWSDFAGDDWQKYGMPELVGDPKKDRAQLNATSPLKRAAEINKPVLMAYGSDDLRVPLPHGKDMRAALQRAGKVEVEWVVYENEGHGWLLVKNQVDFWTRVEKFLAKHLQ